MGPSRDRRESARCLPAEPTFLRQEIEDREPAKNGQRTIAEDALFTLVGI